MGFRPRLRTACNQYDKGMRWLWTGTASGKPRKQRSNKEHKKDEKQYLRDLRSTGGDATEPENRGNDRDYEEHDRVVKHGYPFSS